MRTLVLLLISLLVIACGSDAPPAVPEPEPSEEPTPEIIEPEDPGPTGFTRTAHCGRLEPTPSVGESRELTLSERALRSQTTTTMTLPSAVIGWFCVFDEFHPGEAREPRGNEHVQGVPFVWAEPRTRDFAEAPPGTFPTGSLFVLQEEHVLAVQALGDRVHAATDADRASVCEEAMAHQIDVSVQALHTRIDPLLAGDDLITQGRPARASRAVERIRDLCAPTDEAAN